MGILRRDQQLLLLALAWNGTIWAFAPSSRARVSFVAPETLAFSPLAPSTGRRRTDTSLRWIFDGSSDAETDSPNGEDEEPLEKESASSDLSDAPHTETEERRYNNLRRRVRQLARNVVVKPLSYATPVPQAVAAVLKDATFAAVDMAVEEVMNRRPGKNGDSGDTSYPASVNVDVSDLIEDAFAPLEQALNDMDESLVQARKSMKDARAHATDAMQAVQAAAIAQAEGAVSAVSAAEEAASEKVAVEIYAAANDVDVSSLTIDDVDYGTSEMAPPFLDEDQCLVPGEPVIRVEKAPENSRRIFAGIDILAGVDDVWNILTDYANLQKIIPNLVVNEVLELYDASPVEKIVVDTSKPEAEQCQQLSKGMKGSLLKQVGGAKVVGINFSARTTLEIREWPKGLPDFAHFNDEIWEGRSRKQRAEDYSKIKLQRYCFPRPFTVSSLPTRCITMQSIEDDDGEFRMYQGVWRLQPLVGCAPPGKSAMRLSYAVEVSPRAYLPVRLVEGRIARDLCTNLMAIRDYVAGSVPAT